jgi:hypothetical protein
MTDHIIPRLLQRRGVWMTAIQIYAASPDYPDGQYVLADLKRLTENGLVVTRTGSALSVPEYGLPDWRPVPATSTAHIARELLRNACALLKDALAALT